MNFLSVFFSNGSTKLLRQSVPFTTTPFQNLVHTLVEKMNCTNPIFDHEHRGRVGLSTFFYLDRWFFNNFYTPVQLTVYTEHSWSLKIHIFAISGRFLTEIFFNPIYHVWVDHQLKFCYCWTQTLWNAKISPNMIFLF